MDDMYVLQLRQLKSWPLLRADDFVACRVVVKCLIMPVRLYMEACINQLLQIEP